MTLTVIDVASFQTAQQAKDKRADAVIIKATQGTSYVNPKCNSQWDAANGAKKLLGLYHYAGGGNAVAEADYFIKNIKNYVGQAMLVLDWESYQNSAYGNGKWAQQFIDRVHAKTGVWCVLYTGTDGAKQCAPYLKNKSSIWLAGYPYSNYPSFTPPKQSVFNSLYSTHGMNLVGWQYSSTGIDHSVFYIDAKQWGQYANLKGSGKVKPVAKAKPAKPAKKPAKSKGKPTFKDANGLKWYKESGTFVLGQNIKLHTHPTRGSKTLMVMSKSSSIKYDAYCYYDGHIWIRQPRGSGKYGYLATGQHKNLKRVSTWGTFK